MSSVIIIGQWWEAVKSVWILFALFIWGKGKNPYLHNDELRNNAYDYSGSLAKVKISSLSACQWWYPSTEMVPRGSQASSDTLPQTSNSLALVPSSCLPHIFIIDSLFKKLIIESLIYVCFPILVILLGNWPKWPVLMFVLIWAI